MKENKDNNSINGFQFFIRSLISFVVFYFLFKFSFGLLNQENSFGSLILIFIPIFVIIQFVLISQRLKSIGISTDYSIPIFIVYINPFLFIPVWILLVLFPKKEESK